MRVLHIQKLTGKFCNREAIIYARSHSAARTCVFCCCRWAEAGFPLTMRLAIKAQTNFELASRLIPSARRLEQKPGASLGLVDPDFH